MNKNKNIFGPKFKTLFSTKARNVFLSVVILAVVVGIARLITPSMPGSFAQTPNPQPINGTPIQPNPLLGQEFRVTANGGQHPDVYGNNVVYDRDGLIFLRNIKEGYERTICGNSAKMAAFPAIYGNRVVWKDCRNLNEPAHRCDIYMFDLTTGVETRITGDLPGNDENRNPDIYKNKIVWESVMQYTGNSQMYLYDLDTGITSAIGSVTHTSSVSRLSIYENKVVWDSLHNSVKDIHLYDIATGVESLVDDNGLHTKSMPAIYGNRIVWSDDRLLPIPHIINLYMYDLVTQRETQLTNLPYVYDATVAPAIFNNRIVWYQFTDPTGHSVSCAIYMHDLNKPVGVNYKVVSIPLTFLGSPFDSEESLTIHDKTIVWSDNRDGEDLYNIFAFILK